MVSCKRAFVTFLVSNEGCSALVVHYLLMIVVLTAFSTHRGEVKRIFH